jgi:Ca-activated chloride channel family protein
MQSRAAALLSLQLPRRARIIRFMEGVSLWLAFILMLSTHSLMVEASEAEATGGQFHFVDERGAWQEPATLLNADYQVTVSGLIATTRLRQTFRNTSQQWREGVFTFPLPEQASVHAMTMEAGERRIEGRVVERQQARQSYQTAKEEGRQAARLDQQRPNLFSTRLANIPPGESITVELQYQQPVQYRYGQFELRLPTTVTPRYMPGLPVPSPEPEAWMAGWALPTSQVSDAHRISPFTVARADLHPGSHRASVSVDIDAGLPVASLSSPSHRVSGIWDGDRVTVTPDNGAIVMDRDLVLRWQPVRGQEPSAAVFHEQFRGEDYLLAMLVPGLGRDRDFPRELIFVLDSSGSMAGESIRQARKSLLYGLETLRPGDRFNVLQFNSQTGSLYPRPVAVNAHNLSRARQYVREVTAGGGTEMASALTRALDHQNQTPEGVVRQVVFITDGAVGNEEALFGIIRRKLGNSRLFTVGIGSAPNMHFMRDAARHGRGSYTTVQSSGDIAGTLETLFRKMQAPVLADIQGRWPDARVQPLPEPVPDLFRSEPLVQVVRGQSADGEVVFSGTLPDGSRWSRSLALNNAVAGTGLHRLWAKHRIELLEDRNEQSSEDSVRRAVTELSVRHQLLTRYTSFLAIDHTPRRPAGEPLSDESIPVLQPAGSKPTMLRYPQTATLSPLLLALGLMSLMFTLCVYLLRRFA